MARKTTIETSEESATLSLDEKGNDSMLNNTERAILEAVNTMLQQNTKPVGNTVKSFGNNSIADQHREKSIDIGGSEPFCTICGGKCRYDVDPSQDDGMLGDLYAGNTLPEGRYY
jgi:hypothetical protein